MASAQARQQLPLRTPSSAWGTACPPLCAVRGAPDDVLLGPGPSLQILRRRLPALVRTLRGYYGPVRLLGGVRVGRAACAFPHRPATSRQAPPRSPGSRAGSFLTCTGSPTAPGSPAACDSATVDMAFPFCPQGRHPNLGISRLNRRPASASVNASPAMSPSPAHDSRSAWFATPSLWGSFIPYSPPVYPGAFGQRPPRSFSGAAGSQRHRVRAGVKRRGVSSSPCDEVDGLVCLAQVFLEAKLGPWQGSRVKREGQGQ